MRVLRDSEYQFMSFDDEHQMFIFKEVKGEGILLTPKTKFVLVKENAVLIFDNEFSKLVDYSFSTRRRIEAGEIAKVSLPRIS